MYFVCLGKDYPGLQELIARCKAPDNSVALSKAPEDPNKASFNNLIGDIASQVSKSLEGQDLSGVNPMELMNGLLAGNTNIGGIDFSKIIESTTGTIRGKVERGELDMSKLQGCAENTLKDLNLSGIIPKDLKK